VIIDKSCDSSFVGPFNEDEPLSGFGIFIGEAMRVVNFTLGPEVTFKGIKLRRYIIDHNQLMNATTILANANYRHDGPDGLIPIRMLRRGADLWLSQPRFMNSAPWVRSNMQSFPAPDASIHETFVDVEPLSGALMFGRKRLQANFRLDASIFDGAINRKMFDSATIKTFFIPLYWVQEGGEIEDEDAADFRSGIYDTRDLSDIVQIVALAVGIVLLIVSIFCVGFWCKKDDHLGMQKLQSQSGLIGTGKSSTQL
jgi:lysosome membrane protein 2